MRRRTLSLAHPEEARSDAAARPARIARVADPATAERLDGLERERLAVCREAGDRHVERSPGLVDVARRRLARVDHGLLTKAPAVPVDDHLGPHAKLECA